MRIPMKRFLGRVVVVCASALVIGAALPACVENDQSIFIRSVLRPSTNRQNGACIYTADPQQAELFRGILDVGIRDNYRSILLVGSQMLSRGDPANTRAEPNRVHLNGAVVRVQEPNGAQIAEFTSLASGFADVGNNNNPGYGVMQIVTIDAPTAEALRQQVPQARPGQQSAFKQVVVQLKAFGKTLGGVDLESNEHQFTLDVCNGCLVTRVLDPAQPTAGCPDSTAAATDQGPCEAGQDEPTPCQLCRGKAVCDNP